MFYTKTITGAKPLRIKFDKIDGFIRIYDGSRYLVLFRGEKYDLIYNRIRYLDTIDVSEGIDVNKTSASEECDICHYWYFKKLKFQPNVFNGCHDVLMMTVNLSDNAILNIKGADYCCIIKGISKSDAVNLLQNADFTKERGVL